ncbi:MAG: ABC transporter substrate-binding protein [Clostridia bacterium]|nr:ABC transporter substrate-binding protein [Clostridia bacterium]
MKKIIIILIIIVVLGIAGILIYDQVTTNNVDTSDLTTIQVNEVTRSVFYAPQYLAIENGYFEEEGLELELTTGQGADKVMTAVLAGQSDIGFCGPEAAIYVYNEGKEDYIEVFAQMTQKDGSFLVSKEPTDNFQWADLKGKTVIPGRKGGVPYMTFEYVLKQNGINPQTDLVLDDSIKFDLMAGAFAGGEAEYVTLFEPTASMTEEAGKGYIVASVGEASGEIPYTAYCAKKSYIQNSPDIIEGFTRAIYKGEQWVKEHSAGEIAEKIKGFFPDSTVKSLETAIQKYKDIDAWKENPILEKEAFDKLQLVMTEAGELDTKAPYDKIVNNTFAEKVSK